MLLHDYSEEAEKDFLKLESQLQSYFKKHVEKLCSMPPRRHMRKGLRYYVEEVTKQARLVYDLVDGGSVLFVVRCFALHKEYEKWCKSFK